MKSKIPLPQEPDISAKFPGVSVHVDNDVSEDAVRIRTALRVYGLCIVSGDELSRARDPYALLSHHTEKAVNAAMLHAAALALPFVGSDWSELFQLGMAVIGKDGVRGEVVRVDRMHKAVTVRWADGAETGPFGFSEVLAFLQSRAWKVQ